MWVTFLEGSSALNVLDLDGIEVTIISISIYTSVNNTGVSRVCGIVIYFSIL